MPKRILLITQLFDPEYAIKGLAFAKELVRKGYEIEVLTAFPSYPGGKIYSGFRQKLRQIEYYEGIKVVRLPSYVSHDASIFKRMLNYGSFGFACLMHGLFFSKRADITYAYHPAIVAGLVAWVLGVVKRTPFIYDVQDLWPDALTDSGALSEGRLSQALGRIARFVYRRSAHVIAISNGYRQILIQREVPSEKVTCLYNWCDESRLTVAAKLPTGYQFDPGKFNVLYAGNFGAAQGLTHVLDAAKIVQRSAPNVQFILMGEGVESEALMNKAQDNELTNVSFFSKLPIDQLSSVAGQAGALLIHLKSSPAYDVTIPSKTQSSMLIGRPILMAVGGEAAEIIRNAKAGICCNPCDPGDIARAVIQLSEHSSDELAEMGRSAARFYAENMSMAQGIASLDRVFRTIGEGNVHGGQTYFGPSGADRKY